MRIPLFLAAAGLGVAVVFGSACSSIDGESDKPASESARTASSAADAVKASLQRTTEARTARLDLKATLDGFTGSQQVTGSGAVDFDAQKAQAHIELMGIGVDGLVDGDNVYAKSTLFGDDAWYRLADPASNAPQAGGFSDAWARLVDPTQLFDAITAASSSMTMVGPEKVGGVDATHYTGNISVPTEQGNAAGAQSTSIPVDVWVDRDGRVAQVQSSLSGGSGPSALSGKVTVQLHDYGKSVDITPPPASQIKDLPDALGLFGVGTRPQQNP